MLEELSKIAMRNGNCRLVLTYTGGQRFAVGIGDGITTPLVINGTISEIGSELNGKLSGYLETVECESAERKAKEDAAKHEAEIRAAEAKLKQQESAIRLAAKRAAEENQACQSELSLF